MTNKKEKFSGVDDSRERELLERILKMSDEELEKWKKENNL